MTLAKTELPVAGWCGGSSPLWSLKWDATSVHLAFFPERHDFAIQSVQSGATAGAVLLSGTSPEGSLALVYGSEMCLDQNGAAQGWGTASIIVRRNGKEQLYRGYCNAARTAFARR